MYIAVDIIIMFIVTHNLYFGIREATNNKQAGMNYNNNNNNNNGQLTDAWHQ